MTNLTHHLVRGEQPAFRCIEGESDDGVLEDELILVAQFLLALLLLLPGSLIKHRTDDTDDLLGIFLIFRDADIVHVSPAGRLAGEIEIPAIVELRPLQAALRHLMYPLQRFLQIVRVYMLSPIFCRHRLVRKHLAIEFIDTAVEQIVAHHLVTTNLHRVLQHRRGMLGLLHALPYTKQDHTIG